MSHEVVVLRDVTFCYPRSGTPAVAGVNLVVRRGEVVAIVGPTGSGKSTLLYLISGVIPHFIQGDLKGEVLVHGEEVEKSSLARVAAHVGMVMQDPENQLFN